jgi:hypothetical protein
VADRQQRQGHGHLELQLLLAAPVVDQLAESVTLDKVQ